MSLKLNRALLVPRPQLGFVTVSCVCICLFLTEHLYSSPPSRLQPCASRVASITDGSPFVTPRTFFKHVQALKEADDGFGKEYAEVKRVGKEYKINHPATVGALPYNIKKNRYKVRSPFRQHSIPVGKGSHEDFAWAMVIASHRASSNHPAAGDGSA